MPSSADPGVTVESPPPGSEAVCLPENSLQTLAPPAALQLPLSGPNFGHSSGSSAQAASVIPMAPSIARGTTVKEGRTKDSKAEIRRARRWAHSAAASWLCPKREEERCRCRPFLQDKQNKVLMMKPLVSLSWVQNRPD